MLDIIRSRHESDRISDFVAIGNIIENGEATHSGFVIQYKKKLYEFHYVFDIEYAEIYNDYYHKITTIILPDEVPAFIAQCVSLQVTTLNHF